MDLRQGPDLRTAVYLAAPGSCPPPDPEVVTSKNVPRYCQMSPGKGQGSKNHTLPKWRSTTLEMSAFLQWPDCFSQRQLPIQSRQCPKSK